MRNKYFYVAGFIITFFLGGNVFAQTKTDIEKIRKKSNVKVLTEQAKKFEQRQKKEKAIAIEMAKKNGWVIKEEKDGKLKELMRVDKDGTPIYYTTYNVAAAKSTRANTLHNGGLLGLNLEGQNMTAHIWDGGLARTTHQEYDGVGGTDRYSIGDGTTEMHYHSAHVTGTIIASGVDANAKGMAPQARAIGYEWTNDLSEATAAATSMLVSNHSYGYVTDQIQDYYFGAYIDESRDWDEIMYNAPYYLMLSAAGNDGDDETSNGAPLDGNSVYDKLSGHATSKNNLVVANAQDASIDAEGNLLSVTINSSSSEGPTDDYRIKPDITGNGTEVYSTYETADDAYNSITGTSMATPNVTGSCLLLQQHYKNVNGDFMRAATLKGLVLHTADDAGPTGPDAVYGWGLMNAKKAAQVISLNNIESLISENVLSNGGSFTIDVTAKGSEPLIASISWTDPAGTANTGTVNLTTPVLVNDLDIRITESTNTYMPYRLSSITTNELADNTVDPYERISVNNPDFSKTYTITVTHKGTLASAQNYTLIISGIVGDSPYDLVANAVSTSAIDLGWHRNKNSDNVLLAVSADGSFGTPQNGTTYTAGQTISGGGEVLYVGANTTFNHTSLAENGKYYYKAWSVLPNGDYSAGVSVNETTLKSSPAAYPGNFIAGYTTGSAMKLHWADITTGVVPDGYVVKMSETSFASIVAPVDGTPETAGSDVKIIDQGVQDVTFTGLTSETTYYYQIYPYTNENSDIKYYTSSGTPQVSKATSTVLWSDDFSTPANWSIAEDGAPGTNYNWVIGTTGPANTNYSAINSSTTANGFAMFDSDGIGDVNKLQNAFITNATAINLTGYDNIWLNFEQYYAKYADVVSVAVSTDNTNWTSFEVNSGISANGATPNPDLYSLDISSVAANQATIWVRFIFYSATGYDYFWMIDDISITGDPVCSPPSTQPSVFAVSNETMTSMTASWVRGTGDKVLVVAREGSAVDADPEKGNFYAANAEFGSGDELGAGNFVIYNGTGTSVDLTGLTSQTTYHFALYEYYDSFCYNDVETTGTGTTTAKPAPTNHATNFVAGLPTSSSISLTWTDVAAGTLPDGYIIKITDGVTAIQAPINGTDEADDTDISDGLGNVKVAQGVESYTFSGLSMSTSYTFKIYPYTNSGSLIMYNTTETVPETNGTTLIEYCTSSGTVAYNTSITLVNFNTINQASGKNSGYEDNTNNPTDVIQGDSHILTVHVNTDGNYTIHAKAWIDWNRDGTFDATTEEYDLGDAVNTADGVTNLTPSVTIPETALIGTTKMRVSAKYNADPTACEASFDGEVEDYAINVLAPTPQGLWAGSTDGAWGNTANWVDNLIPNNATDVVIPNTATNMPVITTAVEVNSLTVANGASVEVSGSGTLNVVGALTLSASTDNTASGALIDKTANGAVTAGSMSVGRYISVGAIHNISSPCQSVTFGSAITNPGSGSTAHYFDASAGDWAGVASLSSQFNVGQGYRVKLTNNVTASFSGNFNSGNIQTSITNNATNNVYGWNLVGNPYPSAIDWDLVDYSASGVYNTIYYWSGSSYAIYVGASDGIPGVSANGGSNFVPAMQGFFVRKVNEGTGNLLFTNAQRVNNAAPLYKSAKDMELIRMKLSNGALSDEIVLRSVNGSTDDFDEYLDAYKFFADENTQLFLSCNEKALAINSVQSLKVENTYKLGIKGSSNEALTLSFEGLDNLSGMYFYLENLATGEMLELNDSKSYNFAKSNDEAEVLFKLYAKSSAMAISEFSPSDLSIFASDNFIFVNLIEAKEPLSIEVFDVSGKILIAKSLQTGELNKLPAQKGIYIVKVYSANSSIVKRVFVN